jgi:hypothetical protein
MAVTDAQRELARSLDIHPRAAAKLGLDVSAEFCTCQFCKGQRALRETLSDRMVRLGPWIESTRFALTADDVRWDFENGRHRYA